MQWQLFKNMSKQNLKCPYFNDMNLILPLEYKRTMPNLTDKKRRTVRFIQDKS